ncbi:MAG TPA: glycosyltransferase family 39 protein [Gemmataceae bacterium]|nr:glycosyltransferase family 39 protein [Gemmataceae bacterium]
MRRGLEISLAIAGAAACLAVAGYALAVIHDFFHYADAYPYVAIDDGLANLSYAVATHGRYGLLTSPIQGFSNHCRHDGFFNYGPWYFFLGAGLTWLFGYSLTLLRAIHLFVLLIAAVLAYRWFPAREGKAAAGLFALALLYCFDNAQWPMVRPDAVVSLFAVLFLVFAGLALQRQRGRWWFLAGLCASCGAFTHLIAWTLVPACLLVFLIGQWMAWRQGAGGWRPAARDLLALAAGGLLGALMFLASFHFRLADLLAFLKGYKSFAVDVPAPYSSVLRAHLGLAFNYLGKTYRVLLASVLLVGLCLAVVSVISRGKIGAGVSAYLLPPALVAFLYAVSLGTYANYHSGYVILLQVSCFWLAAAAAYGLFRLLREWRPRAGLAVALPAALLVAVLACQLTAGKLKKVSARSQLAKDWVSIRDYTDEVIGILPERATVWGPVVWGIETPGRVQLVQPSEGFFAFHAMSQEDRDALAPDFFLMNNYLNQPGRQDTPIDLVRAVPRYRYEVVALVAGEPYGVTRIYRRKPAGPPADGLPLVSVYRPATRQWARGTMPAIDVCFEEAPPVQLNVRFGARLFALRSDRAVKAVLPPGDYLLRVGLIRGKTAADLEAQPLVAVTTETTVTEIVSDLGPKFDCVRYGDDDRAVFLLHRHLGGPVYLSQFDGAEGAGIAEVAVFPIAFLEPNTDFQDLPDLVQWQPSPGVRVVERSESEVVIEGDASQYGYQFASPPVRVQRGTRVQLRLPVAVERGKVAVGVLSQQGEWIVAPTDLRTEYVFHTGASEQVTVVVANCNDRPEGNPPSRFRVGRGSYAQQEKRLYTDLLMEKGCLQK